MVIYKKTFKKANQLAVLANPVRFKILLALFISDVIEEEKWLSKREYENETKNKIFEDV